MYTFITVLIIIVSILLVLIVLVQNPKGGGLSAGFGGFSDQTMGVQKTTDFLEKATWTMAILLLVFSLMTNFFIDREAIQEQQESEIKEQVENAAIPNVPSVPGGQQVPPQNN